MLSFDRTDCLYQAPDGTLQASAAGNPLGLVLDQRFGGPAADQIINGGFNDASGWTLSTPWSISGGRAIKAAGNSGSLTQAQTLEVGAYYEITFDYYNVSGSGTLYAAIRGGTTRFGPVVTADTLGTGKYRAVIQAVSGNNTVDITVPNGPVVGEFDNYTLRKLPGNHFQQATATARPILRQGTSGAWYAEGDGVDDLLIIPAAIDLSAFNHVTQFLGIALNTAITSGRVIAESSANSGTIPATHGFVFGADQSISARVYGANAPVTVVSSGGAVVVGTKYNAMHSASLDVANNFLQINSLQSSSPNNPGGTKFGNFAHSLLGRNGTSGVNAPAALYCYTAVFSNGPLSAVQQALGRSWVRSKMGA